MIGSHRVVIRPIGLILIDGKKTSVLEFRQQTNCGDDLDGSRVGNKDADEQRGTADAHEEHG